MEITCQLCGKTFISDASSCSGCGTEKEALVKGVVMPTPHGSVNDYSGILTEAQTDELSSLVTSFFHTTDVPIVIAIVHSTGKLRPNEYAFMLYNNWGIGERGVNRGALILVCLKEQHIESEIGIGLEKLLSEDEGDKIVGEFLNYFKNKDYYTGLKKGTKALIDVLNSRLPSMR